MFYREVGVGFGLISRFGFWCLVCVCGGFCVFYGICADGVFGEKKIGFLGVSRGLREFFFSIVFIFLVV